MKTTKETRCRVDVDRGGQRDRGRNGRKGNKGGGREKKRERLGKVGKVFQSYIGL